MKIFLEAFVDNNFGDNLFVHILTSRYPEYTFYMVEKEAYAKSYRVLEEQIPNLIVQKEEAGLLEEVDGMFVVGGDMFGNGGDYSELIRQVYTVKRRGGVVAFLGMSLFREYSKKTWLDLMFMFSYADTIVVREETTYKQLKNKFPWLPVVEATDLAFTTDVTELKKQEVQKGLLGVSVRKKIQKDSDIHYPKYCKAVAKMIEEYLEQSEEHQVCFLALSSGVYDDRKVSEDVRALCRAEFQERMMCTSFGGNVENYLKEIQKCEKLICTRFHALVFAILLEKEFLPIIYEEKMDRLLNALNYRGRRIRYEDVVKKELKFEKCFGEALDKYLKKAEMFSKELKLKKTGKKLLVRGFYLLYQLKELLL